MTQRSERVGDQIRAELSTILQREMKDPRVRLATVSRLELSRDLTHARVFVSVLGDDPDERQNAVDAIIRARGFLRSTLAKRLRLRTTPELHIELDRGAEHSQHISDLLERLHDDDDRDPS